MKTKADWREIGFDQGVLAGNADMYAACDFGSHENNLAQGHALLGGEYALVTSKYRDFPDHDCCAAWMAGVIEGSTSVGARMGYTTGTPDLASGIEGAMQLHLMIVRDTRPASATN
ncbi:hypothetical protein [Rhizobium leguminosarum]|uniref:hypothetical protein n=1 Tax=Rhizobium leguminosarum TaxID=384 RepID=UPI001AE7743A|nr:hypothetical protein [Rhizobium leguminosarum]MBP2444787.1 hypothetical protein [Rhizobium leguminosarum]